VKTSTTNGFGPPASLIFAPQGSDFWIASFSIGVSIVRTGVEFWNFAPGGPVAGGAGLVAALQRAQPTARSPSPTRISFPDRARGTCAGILRSAFGSLGGRGGCALVRAATAAGKDGH
jgi:hypothetical protein